RDDVISTLRQNDADRDLTVVRCVGRVHRARSVVESNFTANLALQRSSERRGVDVDVLDAVAIVERHAPHPALRATLSPLRGARDLPRVSLSRLRERVPRSGG